MKTILVKKPSTTMVKTCKYCGTVIPEGARRNAVFCSPSCSRMYSRKDVHTTQYKNFI